MDPEFTKILARVAIIGGLIGVIGAAVLFFAFRAFRGRESFRAIVLVAALLGFVFLCCVILLRLSLIK
jgi:tetrahydromethanopterin S-methyltransferase subunit D